MNSEAGTKFCTFFLQTSQKNPWSDKAGQPFSGITLASGNWPQPTHIG